MSDSSVPTVCGDEVKRFVELSGKSKVEIDRLLGSTGASQGKNIHRWGMYGAPAMASVLLAYIARFGWEVAEEVAKGGESITLITEP